VLPDPSRVTIERTGTAPVGCTAIRAAGCVGAAAPRVPEKEKETLELWLQPLTVVSKLTERVELARVPLPPLIASVTASHPVTEAGAHLNEPTENVVGPVARAVGPVPSAQRFSSRIVLVPVRLIGIEALWVVVRMVTVPVQRPTKASA